MYSETEYLLDKAKREGIRVSEIPQDKDIGLLRALYAAPSQAALEILDPIADAEVYAAKKIVTEPLDSYLGTNMSLFLEGGKNIRREMVNSLSPDPSTTSYVGQVAHQIIKVPVKAAIGTAVTGTPLGGAVSVGASEAYEGYQRAREAGVDRNTALEVGAIEGASMGIGALVPGYVGKTFAAKLLSGSAINLAIGIPQRTAEHVVLSENGYDSMAEQYKAFDAQSIFADIVLGAAFPFAHHIGLKIAEKAGIKKENITQGDIDDSFYIKSNQQFSDSSMGIPTDSLSVNAHAKAMNKALDDVMENRNVDVGDIINEAKFISRDMDENSIKAVSKVLEENGYTNIIKEIQEMNKSLPENMREEIPIIRTEKSIKDQIYENLKQIGHEDDQALANATLIDLAFNSLAKRTGVDPIELWNRYKISVVQGEDGNGAIFQPAYHGSPYRFERFDLSKIGTGEGAQAYGWGQYFAENKGVAKTYSPRDSFLEGKLQEIYDKAEKAQNYERMEVIEQAMLNDTPDEIISRFSNKEEYTPKHEKEAKDVASFIKKNSKEGQLYEVDIPDADIEKMLDWDKPLSEQSDYVKKALEREGYFYDKKAGKDFDDALLKALTTEENVKLPKQPHNPSGDFIYSSLGDGKTASQKLNSIGIVGIKYLDQQSRGKGDGTRNFVIFDQGLLDKISDSIQTLYQKTGKQNEFIRGFLQKDANNQFIIGLTKSENKSTFLHESGHFFLEVMRDISMRMPDTTVASDWKIARKWLGIEGLKEGEAIPRKAHEKWARGFETFLREGKAPSEGLKDAFIAFRDWLINIYKKATDLNVKLNDEVRGVMDRLLATDDEIAKMRVDKNAEIPTSNGPEEGFAALYQANEEVSKAEENRSVFDIAAQTYFQKGDDGFRKAVTDELGRTLNKKEENELADRFKNAYKMLAQKDRDRFLGMSEQERFEKAAKNAADQIIAEANKKKQRVALTIKANDTISNYMNESKKRGISGFDSLNRLNVFYADAKSNMQSVETRGMAIRSDNTRQLIETFEAIEPKIFGLFINKDGIKSIIYDLFDFDSSNVSKEGSIISKRAVKVWKEVTENMRKHWNSAGGEIGKIEDWRIPQVHNQSLVFKGGKESWIDDVLRLVGEKTFVKEDGSLMDKNERTEFLKEAWLSIATGGAKDADKKGYVSSMVAKRHAEHRVLHFDNPDKYLEYMEKYGNPDIFSTMLKHISFMSDQIALIETYGPNPDLMFEKFLNKEISEVARATGVDPREQAIISQSYYDEIAGKRTPVVSNRISRTFDTLRNWLVATHLGSAVVTSIVDLPLMHITAGFNHASHGDLIINFLSQISKKERMVLAKRAGLALDTLNSSMNRWGSDALGARFSSKMANLSMRLSGMDAFDSAKRASFGVTMYSSIGETLKKYKKLSSVPEMDRRIFVSKGISDLDFNVWKLAELEDWGSGAKNVLTPDSIYRIPDEKLAILGNPSDLKRDAVLKLLGHVLEETNMSIPIPTARQRAMVKGLAGNRGTLKGELVNSLFLFKMFPISMFQKHFVERGLGAGTTFGKAVYMSSLIASTTLFGAIASQIYEMINGRDPKNMNDKRFWASAFMKGGSLGVYGDFFFNTNTQYGSSPLAMISGPVFSYAEDMIGLTHGNLMKYLKGEKTHAGADLVRFFKNNIPLQNLWYTRAITDRLIFAKLQEMVNPGYTRRVEARAMKEFGQNYYWHLYKDAPSRAPKLERALGK